ncbi:MAG TPA: polyprenol monophosphomannose synthase [Myxococcota bacterium]|nr:polyprenol monophosphomannose synthase [Myxococcota bacterium]
MRTAVVIPTFNEAENIGVLVRALPEDVAVLVVDDNSPDGTASVARALGRPGLDVLGREGKLGLASAYVAGFRWCLERPFERVVQMDADLSHDPGDVVRLLAEDHDLVLGSRYVPGGGTRNWPLRRRLLSRFGSTYGRLCLGLPQRDLTGGFKAWRSELLRAVLAAEVSSEGYAFQVEMTWRAVRGGASVVEVPIVFTERTLGASKMSTAIALEAAWRLPLLRAQGEPDVPFPGHVP